MQYERARQRIKRLEADVGYRGESWRCGMRRLRLDGLGFREFVGEDGDAFRRLTTTGPGELSDSHEI
jgi:hypothetical protein